MGHLGSIRVGQSDLDDRLRRLLEDSGLEREEFEDLDWFGLLPFFALAGASLRTDVEAHGDHFHFRGVSLHVEDDREEAFFAVLPQLLEQLTDDEQASGEQAHAPDAVVHPPTPDEHREEEPIREEEPVREEEPAREDEPAARAEDADPPASSSGRGGSAAATGSTATAGAGAEPTDDVSESPDRDVTRG